MAHKMTYRTDLQQQQNIIPQKLWRKYTHEEMKRKYFHDFSKRVFLLFYRYTLFKDLSVSHVTFYKGTSKVKHCRVGWVAFLKILLNIFKTLNKLILLKTIVRILKYLTFKYNWIRSQPFLLSLFNHKSRHKKNTHIWLKLG